MEMYSILIPFATGVLGFGLGAAALRLPRPQIRFEQAWLIVLGVSIVYAVLNVIVTYEATGNSDGHFYYEMGQVLGADIMANPQNLFAWIFAPGQYVDQHVGLEPGIGAFVEGLGMRTVITICALIGWLSFDSYYIAQVLWCSSLVCILYYLLRSTEVFWWLLLLPTIGFFCTGVSKESLLLLSVAVTVHAYANRNLGSKARWTQILFAFSLTLLVRFEVAIMLGLALAFTYLTYPLTRGSVAKCFLAGFGFITLGLVADELLFGGSFRQLLEVRRSTFATVPGGSHLDPITTWGETNYFLAELNLFVSFSAAVQPLLWIDSWTYKNVLAAIWSWTELSIIFHVLKTQLKNLPTSKTTSWLIISAVINFILIGSIAMNAGALLRYRAPIIVLFIFLTNVTTRISPQRGVNATDPPPFH